MQDVPRDTGQPAQTSRRVEISDNWNDVMAAKPRSVSDIFRKAEQAIASMQKLGRSQPDVSAADDQ